MPRGGYRPGSGPKTQAEKAKNTWNKNNRHRKIEDANELALPRAWAVVHEAIANGERWAAELLIQHMQGKPGTKREVEPETNLTLVFEGIPRPGRVKVEQPEEQVDDEGTEDLYPGGEAL